MIQGACRQFGVLVRLVDDGGGFQVFRAIAMTCFFGIVGNERTCYRSAMERRLSPRSSTGAEGEGPVPVIYASADERRGREVPVCAFPPSICDFLRH
jgi:hypothetical protein